MHPSFLLASATLVTLLAAGPAAAQTVTAGPPSSPTTRVEPAPADAANSVNVSPLGFLFGNLALSYEHLFDGGHGMVAEASYAYSSNAEASQRSGGAAIGYRWHWRGQQDSGFLGVMLAQSIGRGTVTLDVDGSEMTYDAAVRSTSVTGNVGKRWMLGERVNVTLRLGAGWAQRTAEVESDSAGADEAETVMNGLMALLPVAIDGELSVGMNF